MSISAHKKIRLINPKQPFFVLSLNEYFKMPVMRYGISHFYCYRTDEDPEKAHIMAVPDACIDIIFYCGAGDATGKAYFYGTVLEPEDIRFEPNTQIFGVRFLPCYNPIHDDNGAFKKITKEKVVEYKDILADKEVLERITTTTNFHEQVDIFLESYLRRYIASDESLGPVSLSHFVADEIVKSVGTVKFEDLADAAGYSTRYLHQTFTDTFGIPPKTFARIMRFQTMLSMLCEGTEMNFSLAAANLGYADQSHMIRDFKSFVTMTPKKYLNAINQGGYNKKLIVL
jgi:AraC-like DNA-binding protein